MKIFMLWDMEGVSGLFTRDQAWYWNEGVSQQTAEEGLQLLMADINSASAAALDAGVDELIICDTHHGGGNIRLDQMLADPRITYHERSRLVYPDGRRRWMPGLDETVDGFMVPGHHAKAGTPNSFLPHTNTLEWADFRINGQSVGEMGLETCYAGYWDVPLVLAQGDEAACREAEAQFPGVVTAAVKRAETWERCTGPDPAAARRLTAEKVVEAIAGLRAGRRPAAYKPSLPMTVSIRMASAKGVDRAMSRPGVRRVDEFTVECEVPRQADVIKWITDTGLE
jgi:D-amino peptidase